MSRSFRSYDRFRRSLTGARSAIYRVERYVRSGVSVENALDQVRREVSCPQFDAVREWFRR